jgi:hypothetical protein
MRVVPVIARADFVDRGELRVAEKQPAVDVDAA